MIMVGPGHVEPGGRPLIETLSAELTLIKISVGPMDNNAYLLQPRTGPSVLIDAANDHDRLVTVIDDQPVSVIITTHQHYDHWQALSSIAGTTGARLIGGRPDVDAIAEGAGVSAPDPVWDGDTVAVGGEVLEVIGLVGHTPGSITLAYAPKGRPAHLFTGDSLFPGGPGGTGSPRDFVSLMDDLETKIFGRFGDDTVVHPGHGDDTTLGVERPHLAEWRARGW